MHARAERMRFVDRPRASASIALALLTSVLALATLASGHERMVTAMRTVTDAQRAEDCVRARCRTRWSGVSPSGALRVRVVSREDLGDHESALWLELERGGAHWEHLLGESGRFCGGTSEGSRITSWVASQLVDFHGGPEPEIFVDVHDSVIGSERSVSQFGTTVCSIEAATPSCHVYVGGTGAIAPRTFPARGHIAIESTDFEVPFLP